MSDIYEHKLIKKWNSQRNETKKKGRLKRKVSAKVNAKTIQQQSESGRQAREL